MIKDFFKDKVTISIISLALIISFFSLFVSSVFSPVCVSAAEFTYNLPESYFSDGASNYEYSPYLNSLKSNSNLSQFSSDKLIVMIRRDGDNLTFFILDPVQQFNTSNSYEGFVFLGDYTEFTCSASLISTYNFTVTAFDSDPLNLQHGVFYNTANWGFDGFAVCDGQITSVDNFYCFSFGSCPAFYYTSLFSSYQPSFDGLLVGFPVGLDFSVSDFMQWLIDNDKVSVSVDSGGVSVGGQIPSYIGLSKLHSFLEFYKQFGSSNSSFVSRIWSWFSYMNIVGQSNDNVVILKNTIDSLYREYINSYKHEFYSNSANQAHHRRNINTQTTDDDLTLVTDDSNDDIYTSLLREIIRGIVALQSSTVSGLRAVIDSINNLDFSVNVANDGGVGLDANSIWGSGDITESENYLALTAAFMDKGVDVSAAENMKINYLDNATQRDSFTVSVVMPDQFVNGQFTEKTVTHTIDNTSKMYNTLLLFRKLIAFAVVAYFAIRIRFELPHLIRGE